MSDDGENREAKLLELQFSPSDVLILQLLFPIKFINIVMYFRHAIAAKEVMTILFKNG